jgi:predicted DNA-binding WGR domain protein
MHSESLLWTNQHKYYKIMLQPTLFGNTDVILIWGKTGGNLGGYKIVFCNSSEETETVIKQIKQRRKYRGYIQYG